MGADLRWAIKRTWHRGQQRDTCTEDITLQQGFLNGYGVMRWRDIPSVVVSEDRSALKKKVPGDGQ